MTAPGWSAEAARAHVERRLGVATAAAAALSGGLMNHVHRVWRADGARSVVVKHAPPWVASAPEIPVDPSRSGFEARALRWLSTRTDARVRVPALLDAVPGVLILEDLGDVPDLGAWLADGGDPGVLEALGVWTRDLHADASAPQGANAAVQRTRLAVQYAAVGTWLAEQGVADAEALGACARRLGQRLLAPGPAFVMGDLWPPSVRVGPRGELQVLDWEFSTRGQRCQDLGHLAAHLWMGAQAGRWGTGAARRFLQAACGGGAAGDPDLATHFACEVLIRTVGPFRDSGPFAGREPADPGLREAVASAVDTLRTGGLPSGVAGD